MTKTVSLPAEFSDLADLAAKWGLPTENQRSAVRWSATPQEFADLYDRVMPKLEAILVRLAQCSPENMDEAESSLFLLAAGFAEASPHHELYNGSSAVPFSFAAERFRAMHGEQGAVQAGLSEQMVVSKHTG